MLKLLRKSYFYLFILINILLIVFEIFIPEASLGPNEIQDYVMWATLPFGIVALYGYAYERYIFKQWFWIIIALIIIGNEVVFGIGYVVIAAIEGIKFQEWKSSDLWYIVAPILCFVPYWIGVAKYAFIERYWRVR